MLRQLRYNLGFIVKIHVAAETSASCAREIIESIIWLAGSVVKNASTPIRGYPARPWTTGSLRHPPTHPAVLPASFIHSVVPLIKKLRIGTLKSSRRGETSAARRPPF